MANLTLTDARNLMLKGRPWTLRLEFQGMNPSNQSGVSSRFWLATGRAQHEPVEVHYGTVGGKPTILVKDWSYVEKRAPEKEAKGYTYADTPFVRVQPSTIVGAAPQPVSPKRAPTPVVSSLPGPWARIVAVQKQADGTWWGLDNNGRRVLQMTKDGARNLVAGHQHITVVGL